MRGLNRAAICRGSRIDEHIEQFKLPPILSPNR